MNLKCNYGTATQLLISLMIKKRTRPQPRVREISVDREEEDSLPEGEDSSLPYVSLRLLKIVSSRYYSLADLIELRKLRRARQGIDVTKLNNGDIKKKKKRPREEGDQGGLRKGAVVVDEEE